MIRRRLLYWLADDASAPQLALICALVIGLGFLLGQIGR